MKKILGVLTCLFVLVACDTSKENLVLPLDDPEYATEQEIKEAESDLKVAEENLAEYISDTLEIMEGGEEIAVEEAVEDVLDKEEWVEIKERRLEAVKTRRIYNDEFRVENGIGIVRHYIPFSSNSFKQKVTDYLSEVIPAYSDMTDDGMIIAITYRDGDKYRTAVLSYFKPETIEEVKDSDYISPVFSDGTYVHPEYREYITGKHYEMGEIPLEFYNQISISEEASSKQKKESNNAKTDAFVIRLIIIATIIGIVYILGNKERRQRYWQILKDDAERINRLTEEESARKRNAKLEKNIPKCPNCGSRHSQYGQRKFSLGRAFVGGVLAGPVGVAGGLTGKKVQVQCQDCGMVYDWKFKKVK